MNKKQIVLAVAMMMAGLTAVWVGQASAAPCSITVPTDQPTIQDAIDNASAGDKICVQPGTYSEDLTITTNNLELAGSGFPTIQGVATVPASMFPLADPNIDIRADGVSIHGFTIQSPVVTAGRYSSGMVLTGMNIKIYDNKFFVGTGDISQGIQTWNTVANMSVTPQDISGLRIYNNTFAPLTPVTGLGAYEGIYINAQEVEVSQENPPVLIENNRFSGEVIRAISTERPYTTILNNRMSTDLDGPLFDTYPIGIQLRAGSNHSVLRNKVDDNGTSVFQIGIDVKSGVSHSTIEKNDVDGAAQIGINVNDSATGNDLEKNRVMNSGTDLVDGNANCDSNTWTKNIFNTSGSACIH